MSDQTTTAQHASQLKIHAVKILKGKGDKPFTVNIDYTEHFPDGFKSNIPGEFNYLPHNDFQICFKKLRPHLAILTESIHPQQVSDTELMDKFKVHGFSFTDDESKFVLKGQRSSSRGMITLNSNPISFDTERKNGYALVDELEDILLTARREAAAYIRREKLAPDPQGSLFDEDATTNAQVARPVIFPEGESDQSALYGQEPAEVIEKGLTSVGSRLSKADPEAMKRVAEMGKPATSVESVVSNIVAEVNGKIKKGRGKKQTAENPSGAEHE